MDTKNVGLRGIKIADTRISDVDGEKGNLIYRGYNICDLV
ncbi:MAG: citrate/2-methylcitrate synthase, partial [Thermodesulfobacteriota bacterium]